VKFKERLHIDEERIKRESRMSCIAVYRRKGPHGNAEKGGAGVPARNKHSVSANDTQKYSGEKNSVNRRRDKTTSHIRPRGRDEGYTVKEKYWDTWRALPVHKKGSGYISWCKRRIKRPSDSEPHTRLNVFAVMDEGRKRRKGSNALIMRAEGTGLKKKSLEGSAAPDDDCKKRTN